MGPAVTWSADADELRRCGSGWAAGRRWTWIRRSGEGRGLKVLHVVGTRPNFMKVAPVMRALYGSDHLEQVLVHTGQHYDHAMSRAFFDDLELPEPDYFLRVGRGSHTEQTGRAMLALEPVLRDEAPDLVVVPGDVNSTLAAALTAAKLDLPVAHLEAG